MQTIDQKLNSFIDSTIVNHVAHVTEKDNDSIPFKNYQFLRGLIFEERVSVHSPTIIPRGKTSFIGAYSYINDGGYIRDNVFIGRYCSIGRRCSIGAINHNLFSISTHPFLGVKEYSKFKSAIQAYSDDEFQKIFGLSKRNSRDSLTIIENDVWIGDGAVIIQGVRIGSGAVIGANAVVTKDVQPYTIVGGVPAKPIRKRLSDSIAEVLLQLGYWNYRPDLLQLLPREDVFQFIREAKNLLSHNEIADFPSYILK